MKTVGTQNVKSKPLKLLIKIWHYLNLPGEKAGMKNLIAATIKAVQAKFVAETRQLEIIFNNGAEYRWPVDALEMLIFRDGKWLNLSPRPSDDQLKDVEIWPDGEIVEFSQISQGFEISELVRGKLGSEVWMRSLIEKSESTT